jgi:hypothetical protein
MSTKLTAMSTATMVEGDMQTFQSIAPCSPPATPFMLVSRELDAYLAKVIHHNILKNGAKFNCVPDVRLLFARQVYALCIAAPLDVVHSIITPAMFIVTN